MLAYVCCLVQFGEGHAEFKIKNVVNFCDLKKISIPARNGRVFAMSI